MVDPDLLYPWPVGSPAVSRSQDPAFSKDCVFFSKAIYLDQLEDRGGSDGLGYARNAKEVGRRHLLPGDHASHS